MSEISDKRDALLKELREKTARELKNAKWAHWLNIVAMFLTLVTTGVAVVYGLLPGHSSQITAGLALIPGGIALMATSLKLEARCNWHYKKAYSLDILVRALALERPLEPTQEELTKVSQALGKLEIDSEQVWEATVSLDWEHFKKH